MEESRRLEEQHGKICALFSTSHSDIVFLKVETEAEGFSLTARIKSDSVEGETSSSKCDNVKKKFESVSNTGYIVNETVPNPKRFLYSKSYVCQHSSRKKGVNKSGRRIRDFCCSSNMLVKIKNRTVDTMKKDPLLKKGFDLEITLRFVHTHRTDVAEALGFLRCSAETEKVIMEYYKSNHTPSTAKMMHEMNLIELADGIELTRLLANGRENPSIRTFINIYQKFRKQIFGTRNEYDVQTLLLKKKEELEQKGVTVLLKEESGTVVVITPIMRRSHLEKFSGEVVFVDSTSSCDQTGMSCTFLFGATKIGAVPLAVAFHKAQTEENYVTAFEMIKEELGTTAFGGKGYPDNFRIDDSKAEFNALQRVFPGSKIYLCSFHVLQSVWRWLWDAKNTIASSDKQYLVLGFRDIMYCTSQIELDELCETFISSDAMRKYPNFISYVKDTWFGRKNLWALCLRGENVTRGHHTNNFVESAIRVFKEIILVRCKAFNVVALVDYVANNLEKYHCARLMRFTSLGDSKNRSIFKKHMLLAQGLVVKLNGSTQCLVSSSQDPKMMYTVNLVSETCNCPRGQFGHFCKHLLAAAEEKKIALFSSPKISYEDCVMFANLALGAKNVDPDFFKPMMFSESPLARHKLQAECDSENNPAESSPGKSSPRPVLAPIHIDTESIQKACDNYLENQAKMIELIKSDPTKYCLQTLNRVNYVIENISTPHGALAFLNSQSAASKSNKIGVNAASISRRVTNDDGKKYGGKSRLSSGRKASTESASGKSRKRKRDLSENIWLNQPNAKSHN